VLTFDHNEVWSKVVSPHWELSNSMWHATWTWGNRSDSWLLMVGNQIGDLIPDLYFGHNLCFRCSNGSCEPISDIYILRVSQWYNERFNLLSFNPCNCFMKIQKSIWDFNSQDESSFGSVRVHSLTFFCTPGSMRCDSWASFLACTFTSPCLSHEPKARLWHS
jgi:hypothetical protein